MKGHKRTLEMDDLYEPLRDHRSSELGEKMSQAWEHQIEQCKETGRRPSLLRAALSVFGWKIAGLGLMLCCIELIFKYAYIFFSKKIVNFTTLIAYTEYLNQYTLVD